MTYQEIMAAKAVQAEKDAAKKETSFEIIKSTEAGHEAMFMASHAAGTQIEIDSVSRESVTMRPCAITSVASANCSVAGKVGFMLRGRDLLTNAPLVNWVYPLATDEPPVVGSHRNFPAIHIPKGSVALQAEWVTNAAGERVRSLTAMTCLKALTDSSFVGAPKAMVELLLNETAAAMITAPKAAAEKPATVVVP